MTWRPQLVALDVDGTVADEHDRVSPRVVAAVAAARAAGTHVLVSTGRSMLAARSVVRTLGLHARTHVFSNGAVTARLDPDEIVDLVTFDPAPVVRLMHERVPGLRFAVEDHGVGYRVNAPFPDGELAGKVEVCDLDELVARPATRVVVRQPAIGAEEFLDVVESIGLHEVNYVVGYSAWLDIAPEGVSKASALEPMRVALGVPADATLAIGDGRNDIEMLRWAARGVAMGGAVVEVQDAADDVTRDFADDGAAVELERWFVPR